MYYIGIDLGGTNIKAGLVDEKGNILHKDSVKTLAHRHYSEIIADMAGLVLKILKETNTDISKVYSIGIGSPGTCDNKNGILVYANNINFENVPMREEMQKHIKLPVFIENDANCAALGEYSMLDKSIEHMIFITLGTGIGGGIIIDKKIYTGFNGAAGEVGHILLEIDGKKCTCGRNGCWEVYGSVTGLIEMTKEFMKNNPDSVFAKSCTLDEVSGRTAFDAARTGDSDAKNIVDKWIFYVSEGLVNMINLFQPEVLLIGGAISGEGDYILNPIKKHIEKSIYTRGVNQTKVEIAKMGNDAGLIGAAYLGK